MIRIGYVGINTLMPTASRTFRLANYSNEKMLITARSNLDALMQILHWNVDYKIKLFRITSGLIPFASHTINTGIWKNALKKEFCVIGDFIKKNSIRVSMHPGQYTVLNSPTELFYHRSLKDLEYHCDVLDLMNLDPSHKVIIHGGGVYNDKEKSTTVLIKRLSKLKQSISRRLVIENDERNYNAEEIYKICMITGFPGVLDVFHHQCFPSFDNLNITELVTKYKETWPSTQRQKIHYSNQAPEKNKGAHSEKIDIVQFSQFYDLIKRLDLDIMLETKDKQASVLRLRQKFPELS